MNIEEGMSLETHVFRDELAFSWFRGHDTDKLLGRDLEVGHITRTILVFLQSKLRMKVPWVPLFFGDTVAAVGMEQQPLTTTRKDGWCLLWELLRGFSLPLNHTFLCHGPKLCVLLSQTHSLLFIHGKSDWQSNRIYFSLIGTLGWAWAKPELVRYYLPTVELKRLLESWGTRRSLSWNWSSGSLSWFQSCFLIPHLLPSQSTLSLPSTSHMWTCRIP